MLSFCHDEQLYQHLAAILAVERVRVSVSGLTTTHFSASFGLSIREISVA